MTHAELRARDRTPSGLEPTACPGEVEIQGSIYNPGDDDATMDVYGCALCGHMIPVERETGRVRNDYPVPKRDRKP